MCYKTIVFYSLMINVIAWLLCYVMFLLLRTLHAVGIASGEAMSSGWEKWEWGSSHGPHLSSLYLPPMKCYYMFQVLMMIHNFIFPLILIRVSVYTYCTTIYCCSDFTVVEVSQLYKTYSAEVKHTFSLSLRHRNHCGYSNEYLVVVEEWPRKPVLIVGRKWEISSGLIV